MAKSDDDRKAALERARKEYKGLVRVKDVKVETALIERPRPDEASARKKEGHEPDMRVEYTIIESGTHREPKEEEEPPPQFERRYRIISPRREQKKVPSVGSMQPNDFKR